MQVSVKITVTMTVSHDGVEMRPTQADASHVWDGGPVEIPASGFINLAEMALMQAGGVLKGNP